MNTATHPFVPTDGAVAPIAWVREHLSDGMRAVLRQACRDHGEPAEDAVTIQERRAHFFARIRWPRADLLLPLAGQAPLGALTGAGA